MRQGSETSPRDGKESARGSFDDRAAAASDIVQDSWVLRRAPRPLRPYLRLARVDRPIGTWLLLFPCWWSMALALKSTSNFAQLAWQDWAPAFLFALGALVMRAAGCTVNDIADRDVDAKVARTAARPIPSGQVTLLQASLFLAMLLLIGLVILLQFNGFTIVLGVLSLGLVAVYPFMKRITYWPQAWLGLTFNWGALMGWTAVAGDLAAAPLLLYAAAFFWTLGYDTIYAHQDKEDDALVGVKSTALRLGDNTKPWLLGFYGLATLLFAAVGANLGFGWVYYIAVAGIALHFLWQIGTLDTGQPSNCLTRFKANRFIGWILLAGILATGF